MFTLYQLRLMYSSFMKIDTFIQENNVKKKGKNEKMKIIWIGCYSRFQNILAIFLLALVKRPNRQKLSYYLATKHLLKIYVINLNTYIDTLNNSTTLSTLRKHISLTRHYMYIIFFSIFIHLYIEIRQVYSQLSV